MKEAPLIEIKSLNVGYEGRTVLHNVNLNVRERDFLGIIGPNANDSVMQWGNYNGFPSHTSTLLSAIRERLPQSQVVYVPGFDHTSSVRLESLLEYTSASGKKGFDAKFWKKFTRNPDETPLGPPSRASGVSLFVPPVRSTSHGI